MKSEEVYWRQSRRTFSSLFSLLSSLYLFFSALERQNHMKKSFSLLPVPWICASGSGRISSGLSTSRLYSMVMGPNVPGKCRLLELRVEIQQLRRRRFALSLFTLLSSLVNGLVFPSARKISPLLYALATPECNLITTFTTGRNDESRIEPAICFRFYSNVSSLNLSSRAVYSAEM